MQHRAFLDTIQSGGKKKRRGYNGRLDYGYEQVILIDVKHTNRGLFRIRIRVYVSIHFRAAWANKGGLEMYALSL